MLQLLGEPGVGLAHVFQDAFACAGVRRFQNGGQAGGQFRSMQGPFNLVVQPELEFFADLRQLQRRRGNILHQSFQDLRLHRGGKVRHDFGGSLRGKLTESDRDRLRQLVTETFCDEAFRSGIERIRGSAVARRLQARGGIRSSAFLRT